MQSTALTKIALICLCVTLGFQSPTLAQSNATKTAPQNSKDDANSTTATPQTPKTETNSTSDKPTGLPKVIDDRPANSTSDSGDGETQTTAAADSSLKVKCENLTTVVQKGDRQASMFSWNSKHFGGEFTPEKRCQMVSSRLQAAADLNGGTLKDLQLAHGTVAGQTVICVLQTTDKKCNERNLLFTLKPENAKDPQAVIATIANFAEDGSGEVNESTKSSRRLDLNLGNWERKVLAKSKKSATKPLKAPTKSPTRNRQIDKGF